MDIAGITDKGKVRSVNEDTVYVSENKLPITAIVADGMGGHVAGKTASSLAVSFLSSRLSECDLDSLTSESFKELAESASDEILRAVEKDETLKSMGSTLVLSVLYRDKILLANIGDSRAYLLSRDGLRQLTKDHSYIQYLLDHNMITADEASAHPYRHVITRAVGMENVEADIFNVPFEYGDVFLMCSDGLTNHVTDPEIKAVLSERSTLAEQKAEKLKELALERGGTDNISVIVIEHNDMTGKVLQGRYTITQEIAEGGMSHVYLAKCKRTGDTVAVKVFKKELLDMPEAVEGFKREAYTSSKLHHKNIVRTIDIGKHNELKYIVMEYIKGDSLKDLISSGALDLKTSTGIASKLLWALSYAHSKGVVHKDIKPLNVIVGEDGEPILIDFGIAEDLADRSADNRAVLGTINYFSPEQALGETVDLRTDIYSIGILLYEMTTGQLPFTGTDNVSVALKHVHQPAEPPKSINPEIPESLNKIILKALSKDKTHRYSTASAMAQDLRRAFIEPDGAYVLTTEEETAADKERQHRSIKGLIISLAAAITIIFIAIVLMLIFISGTSETAAVYMPYLIDRDMSDAMDIIDKNSFELSLNISYEVRLDYEENKVVSQNPSEGTILNEGDSVSITVSSKTRKGGIMPNLIGVTEQRAKEAIEKAGIEAPVVFYHRPVDGLSGTVYKQVPSTGEKVLETVIIYVYK